MRGGAPALGLDLQALLSDQVAHGALAYAQEPGGFSGADILSFVFGKHSCFPSRSSVHYRDDYAGQYDSASVVTNTTSYRSEQPTSRVLRSFREAYI